MKGANLKLKLLKLCPYQVFTILLTAFIAGIWLSSFYRFDFSILLPKVLFVICLLLLSALANKILKNQILVMIAWLFVIMLLGILNYFWQDNKYFNSPTDINEITATVVNNPAITYKNQELILETSDGKSVTRILVKIGRAHV
mgnify:FL=1